ncbi:MAG: fibrobacter succinogenes major paralogous domain-containing protein [bacterium]
MKKFTAILISVFSLCVLPGLQAQSDSLTLGKFYQTWIIPEKGLPAISGIMYEMKDSAVLLSSSHKKMDYYTGNYDVSKVDVRKIHEIKFRRQGRGAALLVGAISGVIVGSVIGYYYNSSLKKDPSLTSSARTILSVSSILVVSTGMGILFGSLAAVKTTIPIHGNQAAYEQNKLRLSEYALKKTSSQLVFDASGNAYRTIFLCGKWWMAEDLRVTKYRNGDHIPILSGDKEWKQASGGAMCSFLNDTSGKISRAGLYNAEAVADSRGLCPQGWHVPTYEEWSAFVSCIGVNIPQESGTIISMKNISTFGAPGGYRSQEGVFSAEKPLSWQWWSATGADSSRTKALFQQSNDGSVFFSDAENGTGIPVRCIRD